MNTDDKTCYVVLGMHKCGTTLMARTLEASGIRMGGFDEAASYDQGNKYERREILEQNQRLLEGHGVFSVDLWRPVDPASVSPEQREAMRAALAFADRPGDSGFKDPRTCLTYEAWRPLLPENHKLFIVHRRSSELWRRYLRDYFDTRSPWKACLRFWRVPVLCWKVVRAWGAYYAAVARAVEAHPDTAFLVVDFGRFMRDDAVFREVEAFVDRPLQDPRDPNLFRSRSGASLLHGMIRPLVGLFHGRDLRTAEAFFVRHLSADGTGKGE